MVDAHLGELNDLNARRTPLLDNYALPEWATLIYASSDTGKEYLANNCYHTATARLPESCRVLSMERLARKDSTLSSTRGMHTYDTGLLDAVKERGPIGSSVEVSSARITT